jgi:hypothetical protein
MNRSNQALEWPVALFVHGRVDMSDEAFVDVRGLPKAGHATQRQCSADGA